MIIQTCEDVIQEAEASVAAHKAYIRELQEKGESISSSLRQKAILFTFRKVAAINAETVIARHYELKAVVEHFKRFDDVSDYQIPIGSLKPTTNWTVNWDATDDAHLLIGIWRHGFGSWEQIMQASTGSLPFLTCRIRRSPWATKYSWKILRVPKQIPRFLNRVYLGLFTLFGAEITYVSTIHCLCDTIGGLIREYEESCRVLKEQQEVIARMPVKEGYGFAQPPVPPSPSISAQAKPKRRKTPEYTDSEADSG